MAGRIPRLGSGSSAKPKYKSKVYPSYALLQYHDVGFRNEKNVKALKT